MLEIGFPPGHVEVVPPGIDPRYSPGSERTPTPTVVAAGRLVPVKRYDVLIRAVVDGPAAGPGPHARHRRDRPAAGRARGAGRRRSTRRTLRPLRRLGVRRRAGRPLPALVARRPRVGPRGLGHDAHRGRRLRHPGRRHPHRRPHRRGGRRGHRPAGRRRAEASPTASSRSPRDAALRERLRAGALAARQPLHVGAHGHQHPRPRWPTRPAGGRPDRGAAAPIAPPGLDRRVAARPRGGSRSAHWPPSATCRCCSPSRGRSAPTPRRYLYLDPGRLLERAWSMWDPNIGLGTVTHQNIGYLWPMGPWYWLFEHARRARLGGPAPLAGDDHVPGRPRRPVPPAHAWARTGRTSPRRCSSTR